MQELAQTMTDASDIPVNERTFTSSDLDGGLREAAKKWSNYAIETFDDKLLNKALNISASIAQFCNELDR